MPPYQSRSGNSGVVAFHLGEGSVELEFRDGSRYLYDAARTVPKAVAAMQQQLALAGSGLTAFVNQNVRGTGTRESSPPTSSSLRRRPRLHKHQIRLNPSRKLRSDLLPPLKLHLERPTRLVRCSDEVSPQKKWHSPAVHGTSNKLYHHMGASHVLAHRGRQPDHRHTHTEGEVVERRSLGPVNRK